MACPVYKLAAGYNNASEYDLMTRVYVRRQGEVDVVVVTQEELQSTLKKQQDRFLQRLIRACPLALQLDTI